MYIKEVKTTNKKTGKVYVKHVLVESVRVNGQPKPRNIMQLGRLDLPRELWKQLSSELEARLRGQMSLKIPGVRLKKTVASAANKAMDKYTILKQEKELKEKRKENNKLASDKTKQTEKNEEAINVLPEDISIGSLRSIGSELVVHETWKDLHMPELLKKLNFSSRQSSIAEALIAGRLINPGSELSTHDWMRKRSAIGELTVENIENAGLNILYKVGDELVKHQKAIDAHLKKREDGLFPKREMIYLFDLTNFYFEGQALGNSIAHRGKSKEKRSDCPLVSLGLVVDTDGFPIHSKVFKGNISEPSTLKEILKEMGFLDEDQLLPERPTLIMDRGIATKDNLALIKENNFDYALITRGPRNSHYLKEFENYKNDEGFNPIVRNNKTIHIKKVLKDNNTAEVLCISEGKRKKENAMKLRWIEHAMEDFASLQRSIKSKKKGTVGNIQTTYKRIGRLQERYASLNKYFDYKVITDAANPEKVLNLEYKKLSVFDIDGDDDPLAGSYVIESSFPQQTGEQIWSLYMTLTRVEKAFRAMKTDLGTRPIFHQSEERTKAHLYISILAYHILCNIEYKLGQRGDHRHWSTIKNILSTHQRSTVILTDTSEKIHHIRLSSQPEGEHMEIYRKLKIKPQKNMKKYFIARRL